jgi:radical SAM protein with 4Fe4S-binding SPASM domain
MIRSRNIARYFYKALRQPGYAVKVLARRIGAYLYYRFGGGRSSMPEAITLFLTHRCNLRCKMCGQWGEGGVTKSKSAQFIREEMTGGQLASIIDDLAPFKPNITLFGGEPLLYAGCTELIKHIKSKGMHCLVITNGFLLEELAEKLVDAGLDELNISLDGNRELHDKIRGMPGLFDKIMAGFMKLYAIKAQKGLKRPLLNLQCTITRYNYEHLEEMLDVASQAHADSLTFHNLIFINKDILEKQKEIDSLLSCSSGDWDGFDFEPGIDTNLLYQKMLDITSMKHGFSVDFYPNLSRENLKAYYASPGAVPSGYIGRCLSPWIVAYVFPDGEVRPCLNCTYSFGNAREARFADIWNSQNAVKFRRALKSHKMFPACARCTELYRY